MTGRQGGRHRRAILCLLLLLAACGRAASPAATPPPGDAVAGPVGADRAAVAAPAVPPAGAAAPPTPAAPPPPAPATPAPPAGVADLDGPVRALLAQYAARGAERAGVLIKDAASGQAVRVRPDDPFPAASLYKLFVLWAVQAELIAGRLQEDTPLVLDARNDQAADDGVRLGADGETIGVAEARRLMITQSNNTAAWLLADAVGWAAVDALLRARGFATAQVRSPTVTTPREVTGLFEGLVDRDLDPRLAAADYALMRDLLAAQQVNYLLPTGLAPGTAFAHKTGTLPGVTNDAGILALPDGRAVYLTVLTEGEAAASRALLRDLAALVWQTLAPTAARPRAAGALAARGGNVYSAAPLSPEARTPSRVTPEPRSPDRAGEQLLPVRRPPLTRYRMPLPPF